MTDPQKMSGSPMKAEHVAVGYGSSAGQYGG